MAKEKRDNQNADTDSRALKALDKSLRSVQKQMRATKKVAGQLEKKMKRLRMEYQRFDKVARKSVTAQSKAIAKQKQLVVSLRQTTRSLKKQRRELRDTTRDTNKANRATQGFLSSLRSMGTLLGLGGAGYLAVNRIKNVIDKRFSLALTGGAGQISFIKSLTGGRNVTAAIDLAAKFQAQSPHARFGLGDKSLKGLIAAQRAMEPIGFERANELLLEVTKSLEPDRLRSFLKVAETGDIKRALMEAASAQNVGAVTSALNALQVGQLAKDDKLDPLLKSAVEMQEASHRVADTFDRLTDTVAKDLAPHIETLTGLLEKLAEKIGGLSTGELVGGAAALWLGPKVLKGVGRGIGRGAGRLLPRLLPLGGGGAGAGAGAAGAGGAGILGASVPAAALAIPAVLAVGGGIAGDKINRDTIRLMETAERQNADNRLAIVARANRDNAKTRREELVAKRQQLAFMASQTSTPLVDEDSGWLDKLLVKVGLVASLPDQSRQLAQIQDQYRKVQEEIRLIDEAAAKDGATTQTPRSPAVKVFDLIKRGAEAAKAGVAKVTEAMKKLREKAAEARLEELQRQAAERTRLDLSAAEQASITQLRRLEFEVARTTPLGTVGAVNELNALQRALREEMRRLQELLESVDTSTTQGAIESNKIKAQVAQLRIEEKQNAMKLHRALLDSILAEAMGAGRFRKILVTPDQNLELGLRKNIIKEMPAFTGSKTPSGRRPRRITHKPQEGSEALIDLAQAAKAAAPFLAEIEGMVADDGVETMRPTRSGGRTALGTQ